MICHPKYDPSAGNPTGETPLQGRTERGRVSCTDCWKARAIWLEEKIRFDRAADEPHVTQDEPIWCVVLKNKRAAEDGIRLQSDAWSYRHDLSDIDLPDYEILAKTRPVRER